MNIIEINDKKRKGLHLTKNEIEFFVDGVVSKKFTDAQISAFLMAVCVNSMDKKETFYLTKYMTEYGETLDLSKINGIKVDKHSTGGISDTTTLIIMPILAELGLKIAKMSGRALGYTGGTIDKLESIPNIKLELKSDEFLNNVEKVGASIISQSVDLAPCDKVLYALRDEIGCVESLPLIASSVMSKKLALGTDILLLDVKYGNCAFMKTKKDAIKLASTMKNIGDDYGKKTIAIISDMNNPLGDSIGCSLELIDAIKVLKGENNKLAKLSKTICQEILIKAFNYTPNEAKTKIENVITDGSAINKLKQIIKNQGGDDNVIDIPQSLITTPFITQIRSCKSGYITKIDGEQLSKIVNALGGGRIKKEDKIDHSVGITIMKNINEKVLVEDSIAVCYSRKNLDEDIKKQIENCFVISNKKIKNNKLILKIFR